MALPLPPLTKIKPLGKGAFGKVYLCSDKGKDPKDTAAHSVLKEVPLQGLSAKEQKRTLGEATILQKLKHPYLISYRGSEVSKAPNMTLRIAMEYADGGDLAGKIESVKEMKSHFSEQTILKTIAQAASAMAHCHHSLFLLHRDIKPANLFLTKSGDVKIGDFGLSKSLAASHGLAATKCGSPLYMSPELCSGRPYDRGCDVWALGCVMYEMMTLSPPWLDQVGPRGGMMQLMRLVTNGKVQLTKEARALYSNEACTLLASLLTKPASARPNFRQLLTHPLLAPYLPAPPTTDTTTPPGTASSTATAPSTASSRASTPPATAKGNAFEGVGPMGRAAARPGSALDRPPAAPALAPTGAGAAPPPPPQPPQRQQPMRPKRMSAAEWAEANLKAPQPKEKEAMGMEEHAAAAAIQRSFHRKQQGHSSPRAVTEQQREFVPWQQKYQALIAQRKAEREIAARLNKGHVAPRAYGREWR